MKSFNPLFAGLTLKVVMAMLSEVPSLGFNPLFAGLTLKVIVLVIGELIPLFVSIPYLRG